MKTLRTQAPSIALVGLMLSLCGVPPATSAVEPKLGTFARVQIYLVPPGTHDCTKGEYVASFKAQTDYDDDLVQWIDAPKARYEYAREIYEFGADVERRDASKENDPLRPKLRQVNFGTIYELGRREGKALCFQLAEERWRARKDSNVWYRSRMSVRGTLTADKLWDTSDWIPAAMGGIEFDFRPGERIVGWTALHACCPITKEAGQCLQKRRPSQGCPQGYANAGPVTDCGACTRQFVARHLNRLESVRQKEKRACCVQGRCDTVTRQECGFFGGTWSTTPGSCRQQAGFCGEAEQSEPWPPRDDEQTPDIVLPSEEDMPPVIPVTPSDCESVVGTWNDGTETFTLNPQGTVLLSGYQHPGQWQCLQDGTQPLISISFVESGAAQFILVNHQGRELLCPAEHGTAITACHVRVSGDQEATTQVCRNECVDPWESPYGAGCHEWEKVCN